MKRLTCSQTGCLVLIVIFIILYVLFIYYERHKLAGLYHYLMETKNIKEPLVREEFPFYKEGYERIYTIKPKYRGYYNIFIQFENFDMECDEIYNKCNGEIIVEYYDKKNNIIRINKKDEYKCYNLSRNYGEWSNLIRLDQFIYYNDIFRKDIDSIKIKVNKPIQCFPKGKDKKTYLVIRYTYNL